MTGPEHRAGQTDDRTTVVVITHNRRADLLHTLARPAELPERPPLTVVDNASTDGTAEAVRDHHPRVRLLTPGRNPGACGRNLAARDITAPYLAPIWPSAMTTPGGNRARSPARRTCWTPIGGW